jgi:hypothetical protein
VWYTTRANFMMELIFLGIAWIYWLNRTTDWNFSPVFCVTKIQLGNWKQSQWQLHAIFSCCTVIQPLEVTELMLLHKWCDWCLRSMLYAEHHKQLHDNTQSGFGGIEVACWPLVPKFAGSHPAEAVELLGQKKSSACLPLEGKQSCRSHVIALGPVKDP